MRSRKQTFTCIRNAAGFSLMELAVALMIVGTLMSGVLVAVSRSMANARITDARVQLRDIEEAIYGFAQANGRLPCPATVSSSGKEAPIGGGTCTTNHGFVPVATIGFNGPVNGDDLLLDPWLNPVRYSVASFTYSATPAFTNKTALRLMFDDDTAMVSGTGFVGHSNMLKVCDSAACTGNIYSDSAVAVIFSMGANWATYTSTDEQGNGGNGSVTVAGVNTYTMTNSNDFVSTTYSENSFDDQIIWISPYILFNRLVEAGKLP